MLRIFVVGMCALFAGCATEGETGDVVRPHTTCDSAASAGGGAIFVITQVSR